MIMVSRSDNVAADPCLAQRISKRSRWTHCFKIGMYCQRDPGRSEKNWQVPVDSLSFGRPALLSNCEKAITRHRRYRSVSFGTLDFDQGLGVMLRNTEYEVDGEQLDSARAWLACGLTLVALFLAFGITYSYGVFFTAIAHAFETQVAGTAGLFAVTLLIVFCFGRISGPIADRTGPRPMLLTGGVLMATGLAGLSYVNTLWQAYLWYGLGIGLGAGCVYVPVVTGVGQWFKRQRSTALGIAVSGIGLGTLVVPPLSQHLISELGWREVYWLYAAISLVGFVVLGMLYPQPPVTASCEAVKAPTTKRSRSSFIRLYGATVLINIALYVPYVLLPRFAEGQQVSSFSAAVLVSLIGAASIIGRLALGAVGNRYDTMRIYRGCCAAIALSYVLWIVASSYAVLALFAVLIGVGYGGYIALTPALLADLFEPSDLGRRLGTIYTAVGMGSFVGTVSAGWGVDATGGYTGPLIVLALVSALGWLLMGRVNR